MSHYPRLRRPRRRRPAPARAAALRVLPLVMMLLRSMISRRLGPARASMTAWECQVACQAWACQAQCGLAAWDRPTRGRRVPADRSALGRRAWAALEARRRPWAAIPRAWVACPVWEAKWEWDTALQVCRRRSTS